MKISLITVCYNSEKTIEKTIQSVINQNYENIEYIVIDGLSTDNTLEIIKKYSSYVSVLISEPDEGLYHAINKGIDISTGEIIGILNSDDVFFNNQILDKISIFFQKSPKIDLIFGDVILINNNNTTIRYYSSNYWKNIKFFFGFMPAHPTFYCKRNLFFKYGKYNTNYKIAADFELLFRFMYKYKLKYEYLNFIFVKMLTGGKSNSGFQSMVTINAETKIAIESNGYKSFYIFFLFKYFFKIFDLIFVKKKLNNHNK